MLVKPDIPETMENGLLRWAGDGWLMTGTDMGDPICDGASTMPVDDERASEVTECGMPRLPVRMPIEAVAIPSGNLPRDPPTGWFV